LVNLFSLKMTNKEEVENSLKLIEDSSHLSKFLNSNFDTNNYLITKFGKLKKNPNENFEEELISLKSGIQTIENNIKKIIIHSRQDFLQQVKNVPQLEEKVEIIETGLSNLENSMELYNVFKFSKLF
jgi:exonuclease VII small subunit